MALLTLIVSDNILVDEGYEDLTNFSEVVTESYLVDSAVESRKKEFNVTRIKAHNALKKLGYIGFKVLRGDKGEPIWPSGVVGSLTHCPGYRAAAVASNLIVNSIGIDAEIHENLEDNLLLTIASEEEIKALNLLDAQYPRIFWRKIIFSAKESIYKAWYPLTHRWLGFLDAKVFFSVPTRVKTEQGFAFTGVFNCQILVNGSTNKGGRISTIEGKWVVNQGFVGTVVELRI